MQSSAQGDGTTRAKRYHVVVSGQIAAGKSTLVSSLAHALSAVPLLERPEDDPFFGPFVKDPVRWAFQHCVFFAQQNAADQTSSVALANNVIQERMMSEHVDVFGAEFRAREYLSADEFSVFVQLGEALVRLLRPVDLLIYVDLPAGEALRRIRVRDRPEERGIEIDFLDSLHNRYQELIGQWPAERLLLIDGLAHDFRDNRTVRHVADAVRELLAGRAGNTDLAVRAARGR